MPCNQFFVATMVVTRLGGGGGGGRDKPWDRETMFSQLAKQSATQRFYERAGTFSAVISPVSAARVQRRTTGSNL